MTKEEQNLLNTLSLFKKEKEMLFGIYEEINSLIKSGYDGPFMGEEVRQIFIKVNEYNLWKKNALKS